MYPRMATESFQDRSELYGVYRTTRSIYFVFLALFLTYGLASRTLVPEESGLPTANEAEKLFQIIPFLAAFEVFMVLYFRFRRISAITRTASAEDPVKLLRAARFLYIICWVLSLSVALLGYALIFFSGEANVAYPFFLGSGVLFALTYPRKPALLADAGQ